MPATPVAVVPRDAVAADQHAGAKERRHRFREDTSPATPSACMSRMRSASSQFLVLLRPDVLLPADSLVCAPGVELVAERGLEIVAVGLDVGPAWVSARSRRRLVAHAAHSSPRPGIDASPRGYSSTASFSLIFPFWAAQYYGPLEGVGPEERVMRLRLVIGCLAAVGLFAAAPAGAVTLGFGCITNNLAGDCAIGAAQMTVDVTDPGGGQISFLFKNTGGAASSIMTSTGRRLAARTRDHPQTPDWSSSRAPRAGQPAGREQRLAAFGPPPALRGFGSAGQPMGVNPREQLTCSSRSRRSDLRRRHQRADQRRPADRHPRAGLHERRQRELRQHSGARAGHAGPPGSGPAGADRKTTRALKKVLTHSTSANLFLYSGRRVPRPSCRARPPNRGWKQPSS